MKNFFLFIGLVSSLVLSACTLKYTTTPKTNDATVYIIHGYGATPDKHWFRWLSNELNKAGIHTKLISLPNSQNPDFNQWQQALHNQIGTPTKHDIFVAHSLGNPTLLHYLSKQNPDQIGGLVLVSGFSKSLPHLPSINGYDVDGYMSNVQINPSVITKMSPHIIHIISDNDAIVTPKDSQKLVSTIGGEVIIIPSGGHLLGSDGFTTLPEALQAVQTILK